MTNNNEEIEVVSLCLSIVENQTSRDYPKLKDLRSADSVSKHPVW